MKKTSVQQILQDNLEAVASQQGFSFDQVKALRQLSVCRTKALGGHAQYCEKGHLNGVWYNSCKNRSCPQCRGIANEQWLSNTQRCLLDCPHHHIVFTMPSSLNDLWRYNRSLMTDLLFTAVKDTLKTFSDDARYLAATPGVLSVLHTWGRNMSLHPHIHTLVSHGGINKKGQWTTPKKECLFPAKPVMMVFRGKLLAYIKEVLSNGKLKLPVSRRESQIKKELNRLGRQDWVVHFCDRYDYADGVAKYLARYVKGGPVNNQQLSETANGQVCLSYQSHQTKRREKLVLSKNQFIRQLSEHIPTHRKQTVRYMGLYSSAGRNKLNLARQQLGQEQISEKELVLWQAYLSGLGYDPKCEVCGLSLVHGDKIPADRKNP